jgi:hypothetical protein
LAEGRTSDISKGVPDCSKAFNRWDDPDSSIFAYKIGPEGPLLDAAYAYEPVIQASVDALLAKLREDVENQKFLARLQKQAQ